MKEHRIAKRDSNRTIILKTMKTGITLDIILQERTYIDTGR